MFGIPSTSMPVNLSAPADHSPTHINTSTDTPTMAPLYAIYPSDMPSTMPSLEDHDQPAAVIAPTSKKGPSIILFSTFALFMFGCMLSTCSCLRRKSNDPGELENVVDPVNIHSTSRDESEGSSDNSVPGYFEDLDKEEGTMHCVRGTRFFLCSNPTSRSNW
jgi:hypothetical protein